MYKTNKSIFIEFLPIYLFVISILVMSNLVNAEQKFIHIRFDEKIISDLILNKTKSLPRELTHQQELMLQISDILEQILPSKYELNQEFIEAFENLSLSFREQIASKAAIDNFADNYKDDQAFVHTIAEYRLTAYERNLVRGITKQQTQQHINVTSDVNNKISKQILTRINSLTGLGSLLEAEEIVDNSREDEIHRSSWINNLYNISTKNNDCSQAGYISSSSIGSTIGFDFSTGKDDILGISYSRVYSMFKYKSFRTRDKISANTHIGSIYSISQFNNIDWQNIFSVGFSNVKNIRFDHLFKKNANAKFKSNGYNISTILGYRIKFDEYHMKPKLGVGYYHHTDGSYIENGVGTARQLVERRGNSSFIGLFGAEISLLKYFNNGFKLIPTLDVSIERAFNTKTQKVRAKYIWMNYYYDNKEDTGTRKPDRASYNMGTNISAKKENFKITLGYNYNLRRKYHNHQAVIGIELLF